MRTQLKKLWRVALVIAAGASIGVAQPPSPPDRVEEDWQVVIADPDPLAVGPQVTTIMSPNADPTSAFVTFYLNYRDYPTWLPGGLQIKAYGQAPDMTTNPPLLASDTQGTEVCQTKGETVTWTQRLSLSAGSLNFNVVDGNSTTWGKFGEAQGALGLSVNSALTDLGAYTPDYSIGKSGVSWQSNRAASMTLVQVRYYSGGKLIATDSTPRPVDLTPGN